MASPNKKVKKSLVSSEKKLEVHPDLKILFRNILGNTKYEEFLASCLSPESDAKYIRINVSKLKREFLSPLNLQFSSSDNSKSNEDSLVHKNIITDEDLISQYINHLKNHKIFLTKTPLSPFTHTYKVSTSHYPIGCTPDYLRGHYFISNLASHIPVLSLNPLPNEKILDMCAAPGGKSCHIGDLMNSTGLLISNDYRTSKREAEIKGLIANLNRCGVSNALVTDFDGKKIGKNMSDFDRVLLDAPCSGTGLFGKDKLMTMKRSLEDIRDRAHLQKELVLSAADVLKKGGVLVYSTCSLTVEENEEVVNFLIGKRKMKLRDVFEHCTNDKKEKFDFGVPGLLRNKDKIFSETLKKTRRFYPHLHGTIGFFVAKLQKEY